MSLAGFIHGCHFLKVHEGTKVSVQTSDEQKKQIISHRCAKTVLSCSSRAGRTSLSFMATHTGAKCRGEQATVGSRARTPCWGGSWGWGLTALPCLMIPELTLRPPGPLLRTSSPGVPEGTGCDDQLHSFPAEQASWLSPVCSLICKWKRWAHWTRVSKTPRAAWWCDPGTGRCLEGTSEHCNGALEDIDVLLNLHGFLAMWQVLDAFKEGLKPGQRETDTETDRQRKRQRWRETETEGESVPPTHG